MAPAEPNPNGVNDIDRNANSTSRSLLARARDNDSDAWDRLVELYAPLVLHWCRRWNISEEDIADVFQEVFRSVATGIAGFRKQREGDSFRGWLRTITRSRVCDHYNRLNRQPRATGGSTIQMRLSQVPLETEIADEAEEEANSNLLKRALAQVRPHFKERTWQAFWRMTIDEQSAADVAAELSMTPGGVRVAKSRVLQRLREELGELLE